MFHIICTNYTFGSCKIIFTSDSYYECLSVLESTAARLVEEKEGDKNRGFKLKSRSKGHAKLPFGYYAVKSRKKQLKISIYHKYIKRGYLYNETSTDKMYSLSVVLEEKKNNTPVELNEEEELDKLEEKSSDWKQIHEEIKKNNNENSSLE